MRQPISLKKLLKGLDRKDIFIFLESKKISSQNSHSYIFTDPVKIVTTHLASGIKGCFDEIDYFIRKGYFAAGFISYEAGFKLEEALASKDTGDLALLWFGIFKKPGIIDHSKAYFADDNINRACSIDRARPDISEKEYISSINKIKRCIETGYTYQVNYTFRMRGRLKGCARELFINLRQSQSTPYSALIKFNGKYIISMSPELFFRIEKNRITVKPMKGTCSKGRFLSEDVEFKNRLSVCPKNRSENIMIVDLLRNDLGRICAKGSVITKKVFEVEGYESLNQMTSTIVGRLIPGVDLYELFKALFPSGSVTGAPKIRTMQIIDKLEKSPRGIYTGSIGFIGPKKAAVFNVAIRTLIIDNKSKKTEMGTGSGIVYDADPKKEYQECVLKADFMTKPQKDFRLIETMLWEKGRYPLIVIHMKRLSEACAYFGFEFDRKYLDMELQKAARGFDRFSRFRVRLLYDRSGRAEIKSTRLNQQAQDKFITISKQRTNSSDPFLFYKTTNRKIYDDGYKRCRKRGFYDIIFRNESGHITEGAISNIFIRKNGVYYTPPVRCGLLSGVYRRHLLEDRKLRVREKILFKKDIESADAVYLTNAVRGMVEVKLARV